MLNEFYVLIDVGCHECGVGSEYIGSYETEEEADKACKELSEKTGEWRDGGQSIPEVFKVTHPHPKNPKELTNNQ